MHEELSNDSKKVQIKIDYLMPKAIKAFRKTRVFPAWQVYDYTIPATNNKYVIFFYTGNISEIEKPHYTAFNIVFYRNQRYVVNGMKMGYRHTPNSEMVMLPQIHAYTSHFLQRYNERFLKKDGLLANEVAGLYLIRNRRPVPINVNEDVDRNIKEHGESVGGVRVNDGFCFTQTGIEGEMDKGGNREKDQVDAMVIVYTTFMNESAMTESQCEAIDKESMEVWKRCMEDIANMKM